MESHKNDRLFLEILKEERSVVTFLDSVFGFLYRCTDFFQHQKDSSEKIGFPGGVANDIVQKLFQRYDDQTQHEKQATMLGNMASSESNIPSACQEVVLGGQADTSKSMEAEISKMGWEKMKKPQENDGSEIYNGDDRGTYRWSQTICDIDIFIPVTKDIQKANQVNVKIKPLQLQVATVRHDGDTVLIDQAFPHRVIADECLWSLHGEYVQINLEKKEGRWWDRLFSSDPPIDTKKIDTVVMASTLSQEEHMKIEELIVNQGKRQQFSTCNSSIQVFSSIDPNN